MRRYRRIVSARDRRPAAPRRHWLDSWKTVLDAWESGRVTTAQLAGGNFLRAVAYLDATRDDHPPIQPDGSGSMLSSDDAE